MGLLCDAHKKAQTLGCTWHPLRPFDTRLIRLALSTTGAIRQTLRREARRVIKEQLVIFHGTRPSVDADLHRQQVFATFCGGDTPSVRYRRSIMQSLFNGDVRRGDRIEHHCRGCCSSPKETLKLLCTVGIQAMFPKLCFPVLQRNNWTGSDVAVDSFALPTFLHSILQKAYIRCASGVPTTGPGLSSDGQ